MDRVRADLAARPPGTRSVVLAHAFVTGGEASDSERDITVGGVASVPAGVFDGVDYAALGHLHGCQTITERVRYSGSPLAYSFSEAEHRKSMWLVDLGAGGRASPPSGIDCPVPRPLARLRGTLDGTAGEPGARPATRTRGSRRRSPTPSARRPDGPAGASASRTPSASSSTPSGPRGTATGAPTPAAEGPHRPADRRGLRRPCASRTAGGARGTPDAGPGT